MPNRIFFLPIAALCLVAAAPAAEEDCGDLAQQPMNRCVHRIFERANAEMNAQWKVTAEAMKQADREIDRRYDREPGHLETLVAAQRAWLTFRDNHCLGAGFEMRGGSMAPMLVSACKADLTRERIRQLQAMVGTEN